MTYQVKRCCEDSKPYLMEVHHDGSIDLLEDDHGATWFENLKYCMYCGKKLEIEPEPPQQQPQPYKPPYLSPKDKALEELKENMKLGPLNDSSQPP